MYLHTKAEVNTILNNSKDDAENERCWVKFIRAAVSDQSYHKFSPGVKWCCESWIGCKALTRNA